MHYSYEEIKGFPYIKEGNLRYPKLQGFDFGKDCMDTLPRCEELFEKNESQKKGS